MLPQLKAHWRVSEVAKGIAHELYDTIMRDDKVYAYWKSICPELTRNKCEELFVMHAWPVFIDKAREVLARMLTMEKYDEKTKDEIADALIKDAGLRTGKVRLKPVGEYLH